ncbi:hypothetical protein BKA70DRAFT_1449803 [Coprinopsis sp. MPI-PUGE-AT-0042]|nr:hypothetical protein BKA70DRAFT_1449803 [Coprinopsis sp. MPI-PUGE-AT-0042]
MIPKLSYKSLLECRNDNCGFGCRKFYPKDENFEDRNFLAAKCHCGCLGMQHAQAPEETRSTPPSSTSRGRENQKDTKAPPNPNAFSTAANTWEGRRNTAENSTFDPASKIQKDASEPKAPRGRAPKGKAPLKTDPPASGSKKRSAPEPEPYQLKFVLINNGPLLHQSKQIPAPSAPELKVMMAEGFIQNTSIPYNSDVSDIDDAFRTAFSGLTMVESGEVLLSSWRILKRIEAGQGKAAVLRIIQGKVGGTNIDISILKDAAEARHRQTKWENLVFVVLAPGQPALDCLMTPIPDEVTPEMSSTSFTPSTNVESEHENFTFQDDWDTMEPIDSEPKAKARRSLSYQCIALRIFL